MALTITEEWIRERVQLKHSNLEDVRSLSLPGTYHEKINVLGTALRSFSRLKHLDLSRNAIDSLQGLESLKMLEKLNLYYNNIGGLQELYRLRQNQKLQEMDLRLNPVARNEPDYRLFLIHMLPNLRRLDDRAVRDSERKAALMHFSSDQAATIGLPPKRIPPPQEKPPNPRAEHVKSLAKPINVLDDDDANLMDLIGRPGVATGALTGSAASGPQLHDYSPESLRKMNLAGVGLGEQPPLSAASYDPSPALITDTYITPTPISESEANLPAYPLGTTAAESLQQRYPNLPVIIATPPSPQHKEGGMAGSAKEQASRKNRVQFADDTNLKFQDEADAYMAFKARGQFTPKPAAGASGGGKAFPGPPVAGPRPETAFGPAPTYPAPPGSKPPHQYEYEVGQPGVEFYTRQPPQAADRNDGEYFDSTDQFYDHGSDLSAVYQELPSTHSTAPSSITNASSMFHAGNTFMSQEGPGPVGREPGADAANPLLSQVSDLVDRYWNGAKSLQANHKFQVQFNALLRADGGRWAPDRDRRLEQLEEEVTRLRAENLQLRERGVVPPELENADDGKLKSMLIRAQRDLFNTISLPVDNRSILRSRLQMSMEECRGLQDRCANMEQNSTSILNDGHTKVEELEQIRRENDNLRQEIAAMSGRMKQSGQLQELTNMLQDSHKSLVQTNEHLLRELEDTRARHDQEVRHLHWSYEQLKASVGYTPNTAREASVLNGGGDV